MGAEGFPGELPLGIAVAGWSLAEAGADFCCVAAGSLLLLHAPRKISVLAVINKPVCLLCIICLLPLTALV
jgi:hypothetical protein